MAIDYFSQQFGEDVFENTAPATPAFSNADINAYVQANIGNPQAIADAVRAEFATAIAPKVEKSEGSNDELRALARLGGL